MSAAVPTSDHWPTPADNFPLEQILLAAALAGDATLDGITGATVFTTAEMKA